MAYDELLKRITLHADASIGIYTGVPGLPGSAVPNTGKLGCFVKVVGTHQAGLATAAGGEVVIGVLQNKPQHVNDAATVAVAGVVLLQTGSGGLAAGASVKADAGGKGITASPGDPVYGVVIEGAVAGGLASVLLKLGY